MTYHFFCKYFKPRIAGWLTALWFTMLFMLMFILSSSDEDLFLYMDF